MNSDRRAAAIVGVLFVIATAFLFVGGAIYGPVLDTPDFLQNAYPQRISATIGILIEFSCIISIVLIPVVAYPVLRVHSETLALAYIAFRLFEAVLFMLVDITKLSLIKVSQLHLAANTANADLIASIGAVIQGWNEWAWVFYVLIFAVGGFIFYTALYQSKLLPRWISVWGLIAQGLMVASAVLAMFEVALPDAVFALLVLPIAVQEMVMAARLIIKGFDLQYMDQ